MTHQHSLLLLEVLSEEIPATMQQGAAEQLTSILQNELRELPELNVENLKVSTEVTPRRLAAFISGLPHPFPGHFSREVKGPKLNADPNAIEGFMRKYNVAEATLLQQRDGHWYCIQNLSYLEELRIILEKTLHRLVWPKSMRWDDHATTWVRPIESIACMLNDTIIPVQFGHIVAGCTTTGHRFLGNHAITINSAQSYADQLREAHVILSAAERIAIIREQIAQLLVNQKNKADSLSSAWKTMALVEDSELMQEIAGLIEYPQVYLGNIPERFMSLPREVLLTTLRIHQKYLMLENSVGMLLPHFIIVANNIPDDGGQQIISGNERVLAARLADAEFFFQSDLSIDFRNRLKLLRNIVFHSELGSVYDKVQRIAKIGAQIASLVKYDANAVREAAELCKNDLTTSMVHEFPELQGLMGYYYVIAQGALEDIAEAIRDHYKPLGPHDNLPKNKLGAILAIADKLDTLEQMFAIGKAPTSSKDPYALRRAAIGIIRIITYYRLNLRNLQISPAVRDFIDKRLEQFDTVKYDLTFIKNTLGY